MVASVNKIQHSMKIKIKGNPALALCGVKQRNVTSPKELTTSRET